ncbi:MAG: hypothetical protein ACLU6D_03560 [Gordonibacter urolithinfaciens]
MRKNRNKGSAAIAALRRTLLYEMTAALASPGGAGRLLNPGAFRRVPGFFLCPSHHLPYPVERFDRDQKKPDRNLSNSRRCGKSNTSIKTPRFRRGTIRQANAAAAVILASETVGTPFHLILKIEQYDSLIKPLNYGTMTIVQ